MMVSFVLSFFPRDVLDEILNLIESVSEDFPSYSFIPDFFFFKCSFGKEFEKNLFTYGHLINRCPSNNGRFAVLLKLCQINFTSP